MKVKHGLIDYSEKPKAGECKLFTGNAFIKKNGELVMGAGAAKQVRDLYPGAAKWYGKRIQRLGPQYGLIINPKNGIGVFQVKNHFKDEACIGLIRYSARVLRDVALVFPDIAFMCNFPGIGNGRLERDHVEHLLDGICLPINVEFYV